MNRSDRVVLLIGGVGGAKLALGLAQILPPESLTVIVNTGDDFEHLGLHVSPDIDTVTYTLAGLSNPQQGWGLVDDTLQAMDMVARLGGPDWFSIGDRDLGTNLMRTQLLRQGKTLTEVTGFISRKLGVKHTILPMTDSRMRTWLETDHGTLPFQTYFVRERWQPIINKIQFVGAAQAQPSPAVEKALSEATLIIFGPSNPYLSIDPILSIPGIRNCLKAAKGPIIAVSPIIAGQAVKGPTVKLMKELGVEPSPVTVANHYREWLNAFILDHADRALMAAIEQLDIRCSTCATYMQSLDDKIHLAQFMLDWSEEYL